MKQGLPHWALRTARADDHGAVRDAHGRGTLHITWPEPKGLRAWAKQQNWPVPWFGFEEAFIATLLANELNFARAINESGITMQLLRSEYTISADELGELDALYAERSPEGRPTGWGSLVAHLRAIRRAVEAGVVVTVEDTQRLRTWQGFYTWAHGRYHMLEDGYDSWIGDDS